jgi:predicted AAA+ superfamily ATPase
VLENRESIPDFQGMLSRLVERRLRSALREQPAAALLGPRQVGKTTLARALGATYFDLELESERLRLDLEWEHLASAKGLLVLDEAQAFPEIFPRLRAAIDSERSRSGRFLILGSVSPQLMRSVSDALTGRLALVELTPFLWTELENDAQRRRLWLTGGYPDGGILRPSRFPGWQLDYLELLAQRDLPNWGLSAAPRLTMRLMRMLAASHGQTWNGAALGRSLGLDAKTVGRYVDFLEGAYLVRRLPPYHANLKKRLVKAPKVYWRDSGLAHALLGIEADRQLLEQPWVGASFECHVIEQIIGQAKALGHHAQAYFLRTHDGHEVDLVLEIGGSRWAIKCKLSTQPDRRDLEKLTTLADAIRVERRILISRSSQIVDSSAGIVCDLPWLLQNLKRLIEAGRG